MTSCVKSAACYIVGNDLLCKEWHHGMPKEAAAPEASVFDGDHDEQEERQESAIIEITMIVTTTPVLPTDLATILFHRSSLSMGPHAPRRPRPPPRRPRPPARPPGFRQK
ncbi:unnamed protein product [Calypogeia fissa]